MSHHFHFGPRLYFHTGRIWPRPKLISSVLKTNTACFSETPIPTHKTTRLSNHTDPFPTNSSYSFKILRFPKWLSRELFHCKHLVHYRSTLSIVSAALYIENVPIIGCPVVRKINMQRSQIVSGKFWNVVLEKDEEDQLYRSCEQWISITWE
jgi:hypothetical protein